MALETMNNKIDPLAFAGDNAGQRARRAASSNVRTFIWQLWPGRNWPASTRDERRFVADLEQRVATVPEKKRSGSYDRNDVTALMNALRCGLDVDDLFSRAPGLRAGRMLAAYRELDELRQTSVRAWGEIVAGGSLEALVDWSAAASVLVPTPVRQLLPSATQMDDRALAERIDRVCERIERVASTVAELERRLDDSVAPSAEAIAIGRMLYDPYDPSLWADPYFLPERVGQLMPLRVADLLGERRI